MVNLKLQMLLVELLQEIPDCFSILLLENSSGNVIARASQSRIIAIKEPQNQFLKFKEIAQETLQANGEKGFHEIVISGKKQINLILALQREKYLLWISTSSSTKLGVIRFKVTKFLTAIEKIL